MIFRCLPFRPKKSGVEASMLPVHTESYALHKRTKCDDMSYGPNDESNICWTEVLPTSVQLMQLHNYQCQKSSKPILIIGFITTP